MTDTVISPGTVVVHDYLVQRGGAERVALTLAERLGNHHLITSALSEATTHEVPGTLRVSELIHHATDQIKRSRVTLAPLAAHAFSALRIDAPLVVCSSSGWSHWVTCSGPSVVYCHTPPRWLWAPGDYFASLPPAARGLAATTLAALKRNDRKHATRHTTYVANSSIVRDRIQSAYGIEARVIHPPTSFTPDGEDEPVAGLQPGFVLAVGRNRGYKNGFHARQAFEGGGLGQLVMVGGDASSSHGAVVELGRVSDFQLRWLYRNCRAVLALSHEDFGLTPVEGHLFGKPTVALRAGGFLDSCIEGENAVFTDSIDVPSIARAVTELDNRSFDVDLIRKLGNRFSIENFVEAMRAVVHDAVEGQERPLAAHRRNDSVRVSEEIKSRGLQPSRSN